MEKMQMKKNAEVTIYALRNKLIEWQEQDLIKKCRDFHRGIF
jgi:hypothetical protein